MADDIELQRQRIRIKQKLLQAQKIQSTPNYGYTPSGKETEKILVGKTGETLEAPKGVARQFSEIQVDSTFDTPSSSFEEAGATFEKQAAYIALVANAYGLVPDDQINNFVADRSRSLASAQARQPEYMKDFNDRWEKANGFFEGSAVILTSPRAIGRQVITQAPNSALPLLTTFGGTAAGGAVGSAAPVVGTVAGGVAGGVAGAFTGGAIIEIGSEIDGMLQEAGVDPTDAGQVLQALQNDEFMRDIRMKAERKGLTTAAVDALFQVVGGRFIKAAKIKGASKVKAGALDVGIQSVGEGAGEAAGQFAKDGRVEWKDAALEAVTSLSQSAGQTAIGASVAQAKQNVVAPIVEQATKKAEQARANLEIPDTEISNMSEAEINNRVAALDAAEIEMENAAITAQNQQIEIDQQQQNEYIAQAEKIKEQVDTAPAVDVNNPVSLRKLMGYTPESITQFIKKIGGIVDKSGELAARDVTTKTGVGVIRKLSSSDPNQLSIDGSKASIPDNENIDFIKEKVFDAGYFPDKNAYDEISDSELFDAIASDIQGEKVYTFEDAQKIKDAISEGGDTSKYEAVGISRGMSVEEIADALRFKDGLDTFEPKQKQELKSIKEPLVSELENNERLKNRVEEIIKVKEDSYGLISGNLLSRNLEKLIQNKFVQDFTLGIGKSAAPISTRIKNISPKLFVRLRKYEFDVKEQIMRDTEAVSPFLRKYGKLDEDNKIAMDLSLKNGDVELIEYLAKQNNMVKEVKAMQDVLQNIYERSQDAGVDVEYRKNYFPRRVNDVDGLIDYFKDGKYWNTVEKAFKNWSDKNIPLTSENKKKLRAYRSKVTKEIKGGEVRKLTKEESKKVSELYAEKKKSMPRRALTKEEKAEIINSLVRGFSVGGIAISRSGNLKKGRTLETVTADINKFYENPEKALLSYINGVNETIETSKLFGKGRVVEGEGQLNIDDSVGAFIEDAVANENLSNRETEILKDAFNARFNAKRMGWIVGSIRDLTYVDVMGSPLNAITQFGDLATSMYNAGVLNTISTIGSASFDKTKVNLRDVTVENITQEFDNNNLTSKAVDKVFRLTGLAKIDRVGKLTLLNSTLKKMQGQAKKGDKKLSTQVDLYFGEKAPQVLEDLKNKNLTDDVKFLMFNTLADFQPIARSEMPEYYLSSGNMKLLYILKSFTIKQLDVYRREVFTQLNTARENGDAKLAAKALGNFVRLAGFWIVMGASADYMKDMLRSAFSGDEMDEPEDYVIDNIFKTFGWSRFQQDMLGKDGLSETFFKLFIPPTKFIDNLQRDWKKIKKEGLNFDNSRSIRSIPIGGELYWFWFGGGAENKKDGKSK